MIRAWGALVFVLAIGAGVLVVLGHMPPRGPVVVAAPPLAPLDTLTVVARGDSVEPASCARTLRHRLALTRVNGTARAREMALAGYEHLLPPAHLRPGEARTDTFLLELPGEDFAWRLDGEPVGRLRVSGSHLVEGHR